jgi:uncharacterized membrane protein
MTYKKFKIVKAVVAFFLAIIIAQAVMFNNYILAVAAVLTALAITLVARKKVNGVVADERDFQVAGKAARISMSVFSGLGAIITFVLMAEREANPLFGVIGSTLAYSVCFLLLLYSAVFTYYEKQN